MIEQSHFKRDFAEIGFVFFNFWPRRHFLFGILSQHLCHGMLSDPMINDVANAQSSGLIRLNSLTPIETLELSSM